MAELGVVVDWDAEVVGLGEERGYDVVAEGAEGGI